ncbi:MAG: flagellar motor switch protein FliG [Limisphaerales bacterium]
MTATTPSAPPISTLNGDELLSPTRKLAVLMVMLGPDVAGGILKGLEATEVDAVCAEMSRLESISQEMQAEVLEEFALLVGKAVTSLQGGVDFARTALERGLGSTRASGVLRRLGPAEKPPMAALILADTDPEQVWQLLRHEQPQAVALVLSLLPTERGALLLGRLPEDRRQEVVERLARMGPTSRDVVEKVFHWLESKAGARSFVPSASPDGVGKAAALLNAIDKEASRGLLDTIGGQDPDLCQALRHRMFTFRDLGGLDSATLQRIFREVDLHELATALKSVTEELRGTLLTCISKRAAETIREEIGLMGPIKLRDVEGAQQRVIETVRRLEAEGEVELGARGGSANEMV